VSERSVLGGVAADAEFTAFYTAELPGLLTFLGRWGAQPADAADAAQEAFIELRMRWVGIRKRRAYLRQVAKNYLIGLAKRPRRDVEHAVRGRWIDLEAVEAVYGATEVALVMQSLARLPGRQRQVLAWFYDGYSIPEIAAELGMSRSTVRSNLRHARERLRLLGVEED
jgi:RNA polymerase sigma-70 factor (ECF subfamily)